MLYTFLQNNSGGEILIDEAVGIGRAVVIEASDPEAARSRLATILDSSDYDLEWFCDHCGERWDDTPHDAGDTPQLDGEPICEALIDRGKHTGYWIHLRDGTFERVSCTK